MGHSETWFAGHGAPIAVWFSLFAALACVACAKNPTPEADKIVGGGGSSVEAGSALGAPSADAAKDRPTVRATCAPDPTSFGPPWPTAGAPIRDMEGRPSSLRLTPSDGDEIRCAVLAHTTMSAVRDSVHEPYRSAPETWHVGAPSLTGDGPRIGEYWVQRAETDDDIRLMRGLGVAPRSRYSIYVTLTRRGGAWRVVRFGGMIDHPAPEH